MGAGDTLGLTTIDLFPLIGYGGTAMILALGLAAIAHGLYVRRLKRPHDDRHRFRVKGLSSAAGIAVVALVLGIPLIAEALNLMTLAGFPLGYYAAAQGGLVALVIILALWALRHDTIDAEDGPLMSMRGSQRSVVVHGLAMAAGAVRRHSSWGTWAKRTCTASTA